MRFFDLWQKRADPTTLDDILKRGRGATGLLGDEVFRTAVESVTADLIDEWVRATDPTERENLHREQAMLARVMARLGGYVDAYEVEVKQLDEETYDPRLGTPQGTQQPQE